MYDVNGTSLWSSFNHKVEAPRNTTELTNKKYQIQTIGIQYPFPANHLTKYRMKQTPKIIIM